MVGRYSSGKLVTVNAHWVTFEVQVSAQYAKERSEPMEKVLLSWDDERRRLKVLIRNWPNVSHARLMRDPSVIRFSELRKVGVHVNRARPRRGHQMQRSGFSKGCQPLAAYRKIHNVLYRTEPGPICSM